MRKLLFAAVSILSFASAWAQHGSSASNMALLGHDDLQGRSAYQPLVRENRGRWIAYVGHHGGKTMNPLTGRDEDSGTSIIDVTDPRKPRYVAHIPGEPGQAEQGGAQMVRVCNGSELPKGDKLINGPAEPTPANLLAPQVGRFDLNGNNGAHTALPVLGMQVPEFAKDKDGGKRDIVVVVNESLANECTEPRQMVWIVDATDEKTPVGIATFNVPEASGNFCSRGGRFGSHSSNENQPPMYA